MWVQCADGCMSKDVEVVASYGGMYLGVILYGRYDV